MTEQEAIDVLSDQELIPLRQGSINQIKRLISDCLDADIPVTSGMPPGAGKG